MLTMRVGDEKKDEDVKPDDGKGNDQDIKKEREAALEQAQAARAAALPVLSTGDWLDAMPGFWQSADCGLNFNHLHAVQLKGPRLDMKRLRVALDRLQAQHPRLRVEDNTPLPIHEKTGADLATMNLDLEAALLTHMDEHPSVFVTYIWYGDAVQRALLLVGMRHGPGDGRAVEIALAQLLLLYEGRPLPEGHMNYTEIISFDGSLSKEQVQKWRSIEAEFPPKIRHAQHDTFVQPRDPEFRAVFEGFCLELMRLDASETKALAKASRAAGTTVTGAIVAAAHLAVLKDKRYSQEMGNFASALHWFSEVQPDFWHTAREARRFMDHVIQEKVTFPGFIIQNEFLSVEMLQMLSGASAELVSSLGVLTSFGKYDSFEVLENIQAALAGFMTGINLSVCTSGASGTMAMSVQVTKNIVPRARELAKAVCKHIKEALSNPPPVEPGVDTALSPVGSDFREACEATEIMEPLIAKNKLRLAEAQRTAHGASAMMGDVSGAYTWKTHFLVPVVTFFAILSSGPLQAFPLYVRQLMDAGVFSWACEDGARSCSEQGESLQDLYTSTFSAQMRFFILVGLAYDMISRQCSHCFRRRSPVRCSCGFLPRLADGRHLLCGPCPRGFVGFPGLAVDAVDSDVFLLSLR
ncbi:norA [Symbiodinium microadriaticum]|nr:norA [Symbiodinium microadriaticum]